MASIAVPHTYNNWEMKPALIFDLDGTLWDATVPIFEAWKIVGEKFFGPSYSLSVESVKNMMGKTMKEIGEMLTPTGADPLVADRFVKECFACETSYLANHPGRLFEGEVTTLRILASQFDLYIVSNCQAGYIECFLPLVDDGLFLGHMCWDDTRAEKQVTIRRLMERYGCSSAIYIGDTEKDEFASREAGICFIHAAYGFGSAKQPDGVASSFVALPDVVQTVVQLLERK